MANNDSVPLIGALMSPLPTCLSKFDFDGFPTPALPLTTLTTDANTLSLTLTNNSKHSKTPTQVITQPPESTPSSLPTLSISTAQSFSMSTPSFLFTSLHPYCPPTTELLHSTQPHLPLAPCPSTTSTSANLLSTLFGPSKWYRFCVIVPYSENTILFCKCLHKQVI